MVIRRKFTDLFSYFFVSFKGDSLLRNMNRTPRVLFWHGVDNKINKDVETEVFEIKVFEKQIAYLNEHFEIISIEEFEKRFLDNSFTNREVVLTFDDGYANNLHIVEPILNKYALPFTVFISTEHITTGDFFPTSVNRIITKGAGLKTVNIPSQGLHFVLDNNQNINNTTDHISKLLKTRPLEEVREITNDLINNVSEERWLKLREKFESVRPMNWDEVKELSSRSNVTIGSHCMWHICCHSNHSELDIKQQIELSKKNIEEKLDRECKYFAYPNGDFTEYSNILVAKNYSMGFSTKPYRIDSESTLETIPRIGVPSSFNKFKILINHYPTK